MYSRNIAQVFILSLQSNTYTIYIYYTQNASIEMSISNIKNIIYISYSCMALAITLKVFFWFVQINLQTHEVLYISAIVPL